MNQTILKKEIGLRPGARELDVARREATSVYRTLGTRFGVAEVPRHYHTGVDSDNIPYSSIRPMYEFIQWTIWGSEAITAANYSVFWVAPASCSVDAFWEFHAQAGSDAGAVTLQLEKLTTGVAPDSGTELLSSALSLKATANTRQVGSIVKDVASLIAGDRLGLKDTGTLTGVRNVTVLVTIKYQ